MLTINKIKIPKDVTKLSLFIKNEDGTPYGAAMLTKKCWRKQFNKYFDAVSKLNKVMTIYLLDLDSDNVCKSIIYQEIINKKEEIPTIKLK